MTAPVVASGIWPAWIARVPKPRVGSSCEAMVPLVVELEAVRVLFHDPFHRSFLEQIDHALTAVLLHQLVVVLVGDQRDVAQGRDQLLGIERVAAEDGVGEQHGVLGGIDGERAEPQVAVELEQLLGERAVDVDALHQLRHAAHHGAVVAPRHDVDHDVGRTLLDDVERVVDLAKRGGAVQRALDQQRGGNLGRVHAPLLARVPCRVIGDAPAAMTRSPRSARAMLAAVRLASVSLAMALAIARIAAADTTIRDIVIEGNTKTTTDTVELIAKIEVGDDWTSDMMDRIKADLVSSGLFREVDGFWEA